MVETVVLYGLLPLSSGGKEGKMNKWGKKTAQEFAQDKDRRDTIGALIRSAMDSAKDRGHSMEFPQIVKVVGRTCFDSTCSICGAELRVDPTPPPNGIDISGTAVALNCPIDPRWNRASFLGERTV